MVFILSVWPNFVFGFYIELLIKFRLWFSMLSYRWNSGYRYWSNSVYDFLCWAIDGIPDTGIDQIPYMVFLSYLWEFHKWFLYIELSIEFLIFYWPIELPVLIELIRFDIELLIKLRIFLTCSYILSYSIDRIPEIFYIELLIEFLSWFLYWALPPTTVSTPRLASRAPHLCEKNNSSTSATKNPPPPPRTGFWGHQQ